MMNSFLMINVPPTLEDDMVDYLLGLDCVTGFNSYPVRGHGDHNNMSIAEQVTGRRERIQFESLIQAGDYQRIVGGLADAVGKDIVYWQFSAEDIGRT